MAKKSDKEILKAMRSKVKKTHWIKNQYITLKTIIINGRSTEKTCGCLVGLMRLELGESAENYSYTAHNTTREAKLRERLMTSIKTLYPRTRAYEVERWNDLKTTTRERVLEVLDHAIKNAD